jgi:hypothetical protein
MQFPLAEYAAFLADNTGKSPEEVVATLRRGSVGFARGRSQHRGVTKHHQAGKWEARIGRVEGNKYLYLGTYDSAEEAARAYDRAAVKFRGAKAITNFKLADYADILEDPDSYDVAAVTFPGAGGEGSEVTGQQGREAPMRRPRQQGVGSSPGAGGLAAAQVSPGLMALFGGSGGVGGLTPGTLALLQLAAAGGQQLAIPVHCGPDGNLLMFPGVAGVQLPLGAADSLPWWHQLRLSASQLQQQQQQQPAAAAEDAEQALQQMGFAPAGPDSGISTPGWLRQVARMQHQQQALQEQQEEGTHKASLKEAQGPKARPPPIDVQRAMFLNEPAAGNQGGQAAPRQLAGTCNMSQPALMEPTAQGRPISPIEAVLGEEWRDSPLARLFTGGSNPEEFAKLLAGEEGCCPSTCCCCSPCLLAAAKRIVYRP